MKHLSLLIIILFCSSIGNSQISQYFNEAEIEKYFEDYTTDDTGALKLEDIIEAFGKIELAEIEYQLAQYASSEETALKRISEQLLVCNNRDPVFITIDAVKFSSQETFEFKQVHGQVSHLISEDTLLLSQITIIIKEGESLEFRNATLEHELFHILCTYLLIGEDNSKNELLTRLCVHFDDDELILYEFKELILYLDNEYSTQKINYLSVSSENLKQLVECTNSLTSILQQKIEQRKFIDALLSDKKITRRNKLSRKMVESVERDRFRTNFEIMLKNSLHESKIYSGELYDAIEKGIELDSLEAIFEKKLTSLQLISDNDEKSLSFQDALDSDKIPERLKFILLNTVLGKDIYSFYERKFLNLDIDEDYPDITIDLVTPYKDLKKVVTNLKFLHTVGDDKIDFQLIKI